MMIDEIIDNFSLLDEWDDRYRYLIELGKTLAPLSERDRTGINKVQGCASQVWLSTKVRPNGSGGPVLEFVGDSDAHIVRGLIAVLLALFSGRSVPMGSAPWSSASVPMRVPPFQLRKN
jgi:cysteine desulfuration protein SufE